VRSRYELESELKPFLSPSEKLVWVGKPLVKSTFNKDDMVLIPIGLFMMCISLYWMYCIFVSAQINIVAIIFLPFFAIGCTIAIVRPIRRNLKNRNTLYGLSTARLLVKSGIKTTQVTTFDLTDLILSRKAENKDNVGEIHFRSHLESHYNKGIPVLESIEHLRETYELFGKTIAQVKSDNS
jgi:hypothetical protein